MRTLKNIFFKRSLLTLTALFVFPLYSLAADVEILDMDLVSLMEIQITSAGRKGQNLADVPAAVYALDQEDIRSSGATSIPELLRMVPGLHVARVSSSKWAVSSRGFSGTLSNKLLVQIDGRSVYTPSFSGVYWDMQNVMLEDIERVEVIRGPGATLWGANAVNGVINIITKSASETLGGLVSAGVGDHENGSAAFRYGQQLNTDLYGRFYASHHAEDSYRYLTDESDAGDGWHVTAGGFRLDRDVRLEDTWTLQGDFYTGKEDQEAYPYWTQGALLPATVDDTIDIKGYNLIGRWQHNFTETNSWTLQAYFDYTDRQEIYIGQTHKTIDLDFQHRFQLLARQDIVWGLGYRNIDDDFKNSYMLQLLPDQQTSDLFSGFIQDEINLVSNRLWLTLGTKLEHNDYTGLEIQPSARLLWKPKEHYHLWASVSKAVRTPSRVEDGAVIVTGVVPMDPFPIVMLRGSTGFESEEIVAFETGCRYVKNANFSIDLALFYNDYKDLAEYYRADQTTIEFANGMTGSSYGLEFNGQWRPFTGLTTELNYSYLKVRMDTPDASVNDSLGTDIVTENSSPRHQISLRTAIDLNKTIRLNIMGRYVDKLKASSNLAYNQGLVVDDYLAVDVNICWSPLENLEVMLAGQNLTDSAHLEFVNEYFTPAIEIERSIYTKLTWKF